MQRICIGMALLLLTTPVMSNDNEYPYIVEGLPHHLEGRINQQQNTLQISNVGGIEEYFVERIKLWDTTSPIKVCFFGGSQAIRSRISKVAARWSVDTAYVPLDFGNIDNPRLCGAEYSHIRVGFRYKGYWSTVGTDSVALVPQNEQSMNLALFNVNPPPEPNFSRTVLHEFGHALALNHEHQSYRANCVSEFDWDAIYNYLQGPPNDWSVEQIDHNLRPRPNTNSNEAGPFDVDSIMLYSFPKSFYKPNVSATCYTDGNSTLSKQDISFVEKYYPKDISQAASVRDIALSNFNERIDNLDISDIAKSVAKISAATISQSISGPSNPSIFSPLPPNLNMDEINSIPRNLDYLNRFKLSPTSKF